MLEEVENTIFDGQRPQLLRDAIGSIADGRVGRSRSASTQDVLDVILGPAG